MNTSKTLIIKNQISTFFETVNFKKPNPNEYLQRLRSFESETKSFIPKEFKDWVSKLGYVNASKQLKNKIIRTPKVNDTIKLTELDKCYKFNNVWSPNDFGDTPLNFIFIRDTSSGDALYLDKNNKVMLCQHDPVKHILISNSFSDFLNMVK